YYFKDSIMKITFRILLLLSFTLLFFSSQLNSQLILENLTDAYSKDSDSLLNKFLENWYHAYQPKSSDEISSENELIQYAYEIFDKFYSPFDLARIGRSEWGDSLYYGVDYIIVQNSIKLLVYDSDSLKFNSIFDNTDSLILKKIDVTDFRPPVQFEQARVLYLTSEYDSCLNRFLKTTHNPLGADGLMNPASAKGESLARQMFLNRHLRIIHGHWGGYWHLETHPFVFNIEFNKDKNYARVNFKLVYEGGEAIFIKQNNEWIMKKSYRTWIE
ncbi:hypothetical protein JW964_21185, partial [candidate division KSB1 bacterium]|nr:hypothetical protein [candidate division KSB1 bacterium]